MIDNSNVKIAILFVALLIGGAAKLYLGTSSSVEPQIESFVESVVKAETGIDLTPILS